MAHEPRTSLVPFNEANPETQAAYLNGLKILYELDGNPEAWCCSRCGQTTQGDDILISYDVGDTPIQFCANQKCTAYGPALKPAEA
jgi:hypothetical protein